MRKYMMALVAAVLIVLAGANAATAAPQLVPMSVNTYGNKVSENYASTANVAVEGDTYGPWKWMRPSTDSYGWPTFVRNVQAFAVPKGYVAISQWGHGYTSGTNGRHYTFGSSNNHLYLTLESNYCWFLRTQVGSPCKTAPPAVQGEKDAVDPMTTDLEDGGVVEMPVASPVSFTKPNAMLPMASYTGGEIYNNNKSNCYVYVRNASGRVIGLHPGQDSDALSGFGWVTAFKVENYCSARSQWGYNYGGGYWHYMSRNNVYLNLTAYIYT